MKKYFIELARYRKS